MHSPQKVLQVDLVPTLAVLLGVEIPEGNTGVIPRSLANDILPHSCELAALEKNYAGLMHLAQKYGIANATDVHCRYAGENDDAEMRWKCIEAVREQASVLQRKIRDAVGSKAQAEVVFPLFMLGITALATAWLGKDVHRFFSLPYTVFIALRLGMLSGSSLIEKLRMTNLKNYKMNYLPILTFVLTIKTHLRQTSHFQTVTTRPS